MTLTQSLQTTTYRRRHFIPSDADILTRPTAKAIPKCKYSGSGML